MTQPKWNKERLALQVALLFLTPLSWGAKPANSGSTSQCSNIPHMDHPHVRLSNGEVEALVFLPDAQNGYYRSSRFDWSGVVGCAEYKGHTFWGEWFSHYDPYLNDSITGPVEEFRSNDGGLGYAAAAPGDLFVKIGVGVLRRETDAAYEFGHHYPLIDGGHWTIKVRPRSVTFTQRLQSATGVAYRYTKVLKLDRHGAIITLSHQLKNLGSKPIVTDVYDHDFFMLDGQPTGPGMQVSFPFQPHPDAPFESAAAVEGNKIIYKQELAPKQTVAAYLTGYGASPSDYAIRVEDTRKQFGVEQTADSPIAKFYLWSIRSTISPEAYIHLDIAPRQTGTWTIHYRLFADTSKSIESSSAK
jgi:hypothetical protein